MVGKLLTLGGVFSSSPESNFKPKIRISGREYASPDQMPLRIRQAYDRAIGEDPILRHGAKLAIKLKARIIFNGMEFKNPGEMPVAERRLYQDALAELLPSGKVLSAEQVAQLKRRKILLFILLVSLAATVGYLWWDGFFS